MIILKILVNIASGVIETFCIAYLTAVILSLISKDSSTSYIFKKPKVFLKFWLINSVAYIINRVIHIYLPEFKWIKPIIFATITAYSCYTSFKVKYYKGLIASILFLAIAAILEVVVALILTGFDIKLENVVSNVYYNSIYACSLALLEFGIGFSIHNFIHSLASVDNKLKYFIPQLVAIVICLFPTMALLMFNYFKYSTLFIVINLLQLCVVSFVGVYNLRLVGKHENTEIELANTITYNETLKKVNEGVRGFKHDIGNIVQSILGYIALNDSEGAKNYCQNLIIGFNDINILSILSPQVINDPAIYGVVVNKILEARNKNMTLSLDVNLDVSEINFPKFELSRILGILIDNAIEAGEQTEDKKLIVNMRHDYDRNTDVIVISNSISDTNIDIDKIFEKNYSTKKEPSGFGLYEVKKFLKHNPQAYIVTSIDKSEKLFTQTLTIESIKNNIYLEESTVA